MSAVQDDLFSAPPYSGSVTSFEAAESMRDKRGPLHELILGYLQEHAPASDETIAAVLAMNPSTERPRRVELERAGQIRKAGFGVTKSGRRCVLWEVA